MQTSQNLNYTSVKQIGDYYYDPSALLGKGSFGEVYKAYSCTTQEEFAVKVIPKDKLATKKVEEVILREIEILQRVQGKQIIKMHYYTQTKNNLYIFLDYCDGGSLQDHIKKHKFTEEESLRVIKQVADAFLAFQKLDLYDENGNKYQVVHRDLKPDNILFHKSKVKLADFGFAKFIPEDEESLKHSILGTYKYMAPQILAKEKYNAKCDIWSAGIILYQLIFGKVPWDCFNHMSHYNDIKKDCLQFPNPIKDETKDLIKGMLTLEEDKRLSWTEVYNHPAFKDIKI